MKQIYLIDEFDDAACRVWVSKTRVAWHHQETNQEDTPFCVPGLLHILVLTISKKLFLLRRTVWLTARMNEVVHLKKNMFICFMLNGKSF
jgi:hypothetical protein